MGWNEPLRQPTRFLRPPLCRARHVKLFLRALADCLPVRMDLYQGRAPAAPWLEPYPGDRHAGVEMYYYDYYFMEE